MTSSGTTNFANVTGIGELVVAAYERIQIHAPSLRQEHMLSAQREANFLFSEASNRQPNLWKLQRTQITLVQGTATYTLPANTVMVTDCAIVLNFGTSSESRRYITPISHTEYLTYANQQTPGPPTVYWLNRQLIPTVTFWPVPDGNGPYTWDFFSVIQMQDAAVASGQTPDIPYRFYDWMVAGLAYRLAKIYRPELEAIRKMDATEAWQIASAQDTEAVNLKIAPAIGVYSPR
jgi:hypothetical protein